VNMDVLKHLETQLPLLHLEREYTPHVRPRTDPVSGQTLPGEVQPQAWEKETMHSRVVLSPSLSASSSLRVSRHVASCGPFASANDTRKHMRNVKLDNSKARGREGDYVNETEYQLPVLNFDDTHSSLSPSLPAASPYCSQNSFPMNMGLSTDTLRPESVNARPPKFSQFESGSGYFAFNTKNPNMSAAFEEAEARKVSPARISGAVRSIDKSTSLDTNSLMAYFGDNPPPPADWTSDCFSRDQTAAEQWVLGQPEPGDLDTLSQTLGGRPASGATTGCRRTTSPPKFFATALGKNQRRIQTRAMTDNMGENVDRLAIGRSKQGQWPGILAQAGGQPCARSPGPIRIESYGSSVCMYWQ